MASKALLLPLQTPKPSARLGMKAAPARNAATPGRSPRTSRRSPIPPAVRSETINPAIHTAGNWRGNAPGDEKINDSVAWRFSREPIDDQTKIGHSQAASRTPPLAESSGDTQHATESPPATTYHH